MPPTNRYRWLAQYYERVFGSMRTWLDSPRRELLADILPGVESACDLACGVGRTALLLARKGIRMFAVDLSADMCRITRGNARRARLPVQVVRADMRTFRLPEPVDLVLCEFDALNHVPSKADLRSVADSVSRALRSGGHFYFDVNTRLSFEKVWKGTWWIDKPGIAMAMNSGYDRARDMAWGNVEWFVREGRLWRRHRERVEEVCWTAAEIRRTLRAAGFGRIRSWDAAPFMELDPFRQPGIRTLYLAQKS